MKGKLLLIGIISLFLLVGTAEAVNLKTQLIAYYNFDNDANDTLKVNNFTSVVGVTHFNTDGKHNGYYNRTGIVGGFGERDNTLIGWNRTTWSISEWFSIGDTATQLQALISANRAKSLGVLYNHPSSPNTLCVGLSNSGAAWDLLQCGNAGSFGSKTDYNAKEWYHFAMTYNGSNYTVFINGVKDWAFNITEPIAEPNGLLVGTWGDDSTFPFFGGSDELAVWNRTISESEISDLYNSGTGKFYDDFEAPASSSMNISTAEPVNNQQYNSLSLNFNTTVNSSSVFNCSLYINGTKNQSINNSVAGSGNLIRFNVTFYSNTESEFYYSFNCTNLVDSINTTKNTFYIDNVNPRITWTYPANDNTTIIVLPNNQTFKANILLTDFFLYSYYFWLNKSSNGELINTSNKTNIESTSFTIDNITNLNNLVGKVIATTQVCDGHTDYEIDFTVEKINNELKFDSVRIFLTDKDDLANYDYKKLRDRYSFNFNTRISSTTKTFTIKADSYIEIVHSDYKGHVIIPAENKWVDFEGKNVDSVSLKRISDTEVEAEVTMDRTTTSWEFESIGELNCLTENRYLFLVNYSETYEESVLSQDTTTFTMNLSYDKDFMSQINATLYYNGTYYSTNATNSTNFFLFSVSINVPYIITNQENMTFFWNYSINNVMYNTTFHNQTVNVANIDNCSAYSTYVINFTLRDDSNNTERLGNLDIYVSWLVGTFEKNTSFSMSDQSKYSLCMYPAGKNLTIQAQMIYENGAYTNKTYYLTDYFIDNITDLIDLYFTSGSTLVQFRVTDLNDVAVKDAYVKILRYDLGSNTYRTVEIIKTDEDGYAYGNVVLNNQFYKFIVEYQGVTKLTTEETKISSTTKRFRINLASDLFSSYSKIENIEYSNVTFNNDTRTFQFTFNVVNGGTENICLKVIKSRIRGDTTLYDYCLESSAGTLTYTITEDVDSNTYVGTAYVIIDGTHFLLSVKSHSFERGFVTYGKEGIFLTVLLGIAVVTIMVWSPVAAVISLLLIVSLSIIMGIFFLNWSILVIIIVLGGIVIYKLKS